MSAHRKTEETKHHPFYWFIRRKSHMFLFVTVAVSFTVNKFHLAGRINYECINLLSCSGYTGQAE